MDLSLLHPVWVAAPFLIAAIAWARGAFDAAHRRLTLALLTAGVLIFAWRGLSAAPLLLLMSLVLVWPLACASYPASFTRSKPALARGARIARFVAWSALLLALVRPVAERSFTEIRLPMLVALLDDSRSMGVVDPGGPDLSRAERVNRVLADAGPAVRRLAERYEVHVASIRAPATRADWLVRPESPRSPLAAALRWANAARDAHGDAAGAVLLLSDGTDNTEGASALRKAAEELTEQRCPLFVIGVGATGANAPNAQLDPLIAPAAVNRRDRVRVGVSANVTDMAGLPVQIELQWHDEAPLRREITLKSSPERLVTHFESIAMHPGPRRLTARLRFPPERGGDVFETSTVIDVRDDRLRVLLLTPRLRPEFSFLARALRSTSGFDVSMRVIQAAGDADGLFDLGADVVILGDVPARLLGEGQLGELARLVREQGAGLLLAGGLTLFQSDAYARSPLASVAPVSLRSASPLAPSRVRPSIAARSVFGELATQEAWDDLPALPGLLRFAEVAPLGMALAADESGGPLLVAQESGAGRVAAAGWDATWPWALESDAGAELHRRFWTQLCNWLANRRPSAWVTTDADRYDAASLEGGLARVRVRAGLSGPAEASAALLRNPGAARLTLDASANPEASQPASAPVRVPLRFEQGEWVGEIEFVGRGARGSHVLEFALPEVGGGGAGISARTVFEVAEFDAELHAPTSNLILLRELGERAGAVGGGYATLEEAPDLLRRLWETDRRQRVEQRRRYSPVHDQPWLMYALTGTALVAEWVTRKRGGLA